MDKEIAAVSKFLKDFPEDFKENMLTGAVNATLQKARLEALDKISETYFISKKDINKNLEIKKAKKGELSGSIKSVGPMNSIEKFKVKHSGNRILVGVRRDKGLQERSKSFSNFVRKFSGNDGSGGNKRSNATFSDDRKRMGFRRSSSSKYPIQRLTGPAVPQLLSSQDVVVPVEASVYKNLERALEDQVLKKFKK